MNVGSVLEIYTTMYGWSLFNTLFDLFKVSGLLYYPFLMVLYRNWKEPYLSQDNRPASITSERRMRYAMVAAVMVFSLAVVPFKAIDLTELRYRVACSDAGTEKVKTDVGGGSTATTYDDLTSPAVRIPIIWWLTMSISAGMNYVAASSFSCFEDIKGLDEQLRNLTIKDPLLREEYVRFSNECFLESKSKYVTSLRGGEHHDYVEASLTTFKVSFPEYDETDPFYVGSHFYLTTDGFYKAFDRTTCRTSIGGCGFRAKEPVIGWDYVASRDNYSAADILAGTPGRPYCDEWWTDSVKGVKTKLLNSIESSDVILEKPSMFTTVFEWVKDVIGKVFTAPLTEAQKEDIVIQNFVLRNPPDFLGGMDSMAFTGIRSAMTEGTDAMSGLIGSGAAGIGVAALGTVTLGAAATGIGKASLDIAETFGGFYLTLFLFKSAAPMIQAILLMVIYGLLIVYLVVGEYEVENVLTGLFLILTLRFFTPLWAIADYLDSQLFLAMYPDATLLGSVFTHGINRLLLDMVLTLLYVVAPLILLFMMGLAGAKIGSIGATIGGMSNPIQRLGNPLSKSPGKGLR